MSSAYSFMKPRVKNPTPTQQHLDYDIVQANRRAFMRITEKVNLNRKEIGVPECEQLKKMGEP